jgi:hypothetical protein
VNLDFILARPRLGNVIRGLHLDELVHLEAECLFDAQRHFRRKRNTAVQKTGKRLACDAKNRGGFTDGKFEWINNNGSDVGAGMGKCISHSAMLEIRLYVSSVT